MKSRLKILHLEDNPTDAQLVADFLESEGYDCDVTIVDSEEGFRQALTKLEPDFIFADFTLPAFDAMRALSIAKKKAPQVPFILVSGTIGEEIAIESLKAGADDYVLKTRLSRIVHAVNRAQKERDEIEKRKLAEQKAIEQSRLLSEVVDNALEAVILIDEKNRITVFNSSAEKMFEYKFDDLKNKNIDLIIPDLFAEAKTLHGPNQKDSKASKPSHTIYLQGLRRSGGHLALEMSVSPVPLAGKEYHAIIARDITYRLKVERELKEAKEQLEEKVKARTAELNRSNKQLEKYVFLVSHDLREPLRMVSSFVKLLKKEASEKLNKTENEFLEFAEEGTKRMKSLLDGILEYSRINTKANFQSVDLNRLIILVKSNLKKTIEDSRAIIEVEGELPKINGNKVQMIQLFQNLIGNAIKFSGKKKRPVVKIGCEKTYRFYRFYISDNGIGIHPDNSQKIFQIFQRLHKHEEYPGSGIGLAICKDIVTIHGGEINVESQHGKGSTFFFTIPV